MHLNFADRARAVLALMAFALIASCATAPAQAKKPHNVVIFVADGLRYSSVNATDTPALAALKAEGVDFANSHSLFPTITTVNGSAIATGHYIGDTGDFGNTIYPGALLPNASFSRIVPLEDDGILKDMNARFGGNYLNEKSLLATARAHGFSTAALGKTGPTAIQDIDALSGKGGIVIDDALGTPDGAPLDPEVAAAIKAAGLAPAPPARMRPAEDQLKWYTSVISKVLLPRFKAKSAPFALVLWSVDPDSTQHAQQDSKNALVPGINGPSSKAALKAASDALGRIRDALKAQGLDKNTDIFVAADHGFSTVSKESKTSASAQMKLRDAPDGQVPQGFVGIDLAKALNMPLFQANGLEVQLSDHLGPPRGSTMLGPDFEHPHIFIGSNGGADLIWLPENDAMSLAPRLVDFLTTQDYVSAIFVNDDFGPIPGALPMSAVGLKGAALTPAPAIYISFKSFTTGCTGNELQCTAEIADTDWRMGGGIHGSLHRGDTRNFMAAVGPDFKKHFVNPAPVSNADIAPTLAKILGFELPSVGKLNGRVITESLVGGRSVKSQSAARVSAPAANGFVTKLDYQSVGTNEYYDAAGAPGRAVGLKP